MVIDSARLISFSPTRTTQKVLEGISRGLQVAKVETVDLTLQDGGMRMRPLTGHDLALIGSSVHGGRLPSVAISRFRFLKGNGAPAVIVVVYGNRAYEDALLELRDVVLEAGFKPIAAGAFIGEHSYSTGSTPIAAGRPDAEDLEKAMTFGETIREKMIRLQTIDRIDPFPLPGIFPYKELRMMSDISPSTQEAACTRCRMCLSACPTAAIGSENPAVTDKGLCIRCCACVKICPVGAKAMDDPRIRQVAGQLAVNCVARKEPETYL